MHPMLTIAVQAARAAGRVILQHMDRLDTLDIQEKSKNDFVSEVDHMAEQAIIGTIRRLYPDHGFLAEESGVTKTDGDYVWIIDPLDGTNNFLRGIPQFSVSIALRERGRLAQAVIYDPAKEELFTAGRGNGAQLNGRRLRVSSRRHLSGALFATGFPFRHPRLREPHMTMLTRLVEETGDIRRQASAALDLAYVAAGRLDGFVELALNEWDIAAGVLLVQEAGGLVGDPDGGHTHLESGHVLAANAKLFAAAAKKLGGGYAALRR